MDYDDEIEIKPIRSSDGTVVDLRMEKKNKKPITMNEFIMELENYLYLVSRASREREQIGADN